MTVTDICSLFDAHFIADKQEQLDDEYITSSMNIYTDGTYDYEINEKNGLIMLTNVHNANYLIFVTELGHLFLAIYKYTPESEFTNITTDLTKLKRQISNEPQNTLDDNNIKLDIGDIISKDDQLININNFKCLDCNNKLIFNKPSNNTDTIIAYCNNCAVEYALIPSKFYIIKAKKEIYVNSKNARDLNSILTPTAKKENKE